MVKLGTLKEKTMGCVAIFAGEPIKFQYKPGALRDGTGYHTMMQEGVEEGDNAKIFEAVGKILVDWDIEVTVEEMMEAGYFDPQYAPSDLDENGEPIDGAEPIRGAIEPPEGTTMKLPLDRYALEMADIPGPLFGVLIAKMREDAVSGGRETKKAR